jgi:hypothetical protein
MPENLTWHLTTSMQKAPSQLWQSIKSTKTLRGAWRIRFRRPIRLAKPNPGRPKIDLRPFASAEHGFAAVPCAACAALDTQRPVRDLKC